MESYPMESYPCHGIADGLAWKLVSSGSAAAVARAVARAVAPTVAQKGGEGETSMILKLSPSAAAPPRGPSSPSSERGSR